MNTYRIELAPLPRWRDARGEAVIAQAKSVCGIELEHAVTRDVYTLVADCSAAEAEKIAALLHNPVLQMWRVGAARSANFVPAAPCDYLLRIGFKPGVTDNVGRTFRTAAADILGRKLREDESVFSSTEYLLSGPGLTEAQVRTIGSKLLANELIQSSLVLPGSESENVPHNLPFVNAAEKVQVRKYDLEVSDAELVELSKKGVLALSLEEMKAIQQYFRTAKGREQYGLDANPTDVELEVIAQTWSEHCKHKIFSAEIDYENAETGERQTIDNCYKTFIKGSTKEIAGKVDWLVSVFKDNAGVIDFNDRCDVVYKVETHNSPSALDPYGGAMTGIVGVNRDPLGTGQGAELLINVWGYCLGSPFTADSSVPEGLLHPRRLRDGVHKGVIDGGNQSGIPYGNGWEYFDDRYIGKPLVYCGTVGKLPKSINGVPGSSKRIEPGDLIVMGGGRIGKDGIHGATFSSEELHKDSPVQAVQIGDPITQKKLSDFIMEARSRGLYRFITDNGAGGLSSSVGEMAEECNGCRMDLAKAPLKYAGLQPWEILVSEAQERMSFAVPPEKIDEFKSLAAERDVEVSVLGEFTDDGKFHMLYNGKTVACLDIAFMHDGLPKMHLKARWKQPRFPEPDLKGRDLGADTMQLIGALNICSDEYKARQYDHEVKGLSVLKPFAGVGRDVAADATVTMIEPMSKDGVILASAILPRYSDIDTYHMAASCIDLAVRRIIAVGGDLSMIAGLDNFCWPDPVQSEKTPDGEYKLAQLVRANQAISDYTRKYLVPCISGKDSMKNDSTRGGRKISIPPSLLFSVISRLDDVSRAVSFDVKQPGDSVYVIGLTKPELGGSEYFNMLGATGNRVPRVDADASLEICRRISEATKKGLVHSLITPALGGLGIALAKSAMAGRLGMEIDLDKVPCENCSALEAWFSESNSRFVATVPEKHRAEFEALLQGVVFARVGQVTAGKSLKAFGRGAGCSLELDALLSNYKRTLDRV
ncbi:MAG: AIR synthase-related protein [Lentisphaeria bacterium]|nr:AIR synthase-related protein [Lentisphaeria bacterium]